MAYREVSVIEVREVLRGWLSGAGLRVVAAQAGLDRKTCRRYVAAAQEAGLRRDDGFEQVTDEIVGAVIAAVRPARPSGHGTAWQQLQAQQEQITEWVEQDLTVVKIGDLLARRGVVVPYRWLATRPVRVGTGRVRAVPAPYTPPGGIRFLPRVRPSSSLCTAPPRRRTDHPLWALELPAAAPRNSCQHTRHIAAPTHACHQRRSLTRHAWRGCCASSVAILACVPGWVAAGVPNRQ